MLKPALARGAEPKEVLVILVPEHLVADAKAQVLRYCLNLNFREEYRIHDDIYALLHDEVQLHTPPTPRSPAGQSRGGDGEGGSGEGGCEGGCA